ncbi:MAG: DEAD/DEAH box helicase family protein, partial [Candidatus Helarchaeota archaeon]
MEIPEKTQAYFPFNSTRPGQNELIKEIYYSVSAKKNVIIEAPNGIGKTVSALSSVIPYLRGQKKNRVFIYCTRTHSQMDQVLQEIKNIQAKKNIKIRGISFKGRKKMCVNMKVIDQAGSSKEFVDLCNTYRKKEKCPYYAKLLDFEFDITQFIDKTLSAEDLIEFGNKLNACPYFLGKKLLGNVDLIATSFPYMINPFIRNIFLKDLQKEMPDIILLFDECHNLPDLARDVGSAKLPLSSLERALSELEIQGGKGHPLLSLLEYHQQVLQKKIQQFEYRQDISELDFEVPRILIKE